MRMDEKTPGVRLSRTAIRWIGIGLLVVTVAGCASTLRRIDEADRWFRENLW